SYESHIEIFIESIIKSSIDNLVSVINSYSEKGLDRNQYNIADLLLYLWYIRLAANFKKQAERVKIIDTQFTKLDIWKSEIYDSVKSALELRYNQFIEKLFESDKLHPINQGKAIELIKMICNDRSYYEKLSPISLLKKLNFKKAGSR
ncbi:MAG TPA: hypothetical protein VGB37_07595, partial [Candidatus Lokiarchaeia archaeon]